MAYHVMCKRVCVCVCLTTMTLMPILRMSYESVGGEKEDADRHTDRPPREERKSAASTGLIPPPSAPSYMPTVQNGTTLQTPHR